ncbi:MAG TPA: hypothetical protein VGC79_03735 [Polyangiaceae bacterium]
MSSDAGADSGGSAGGPITGNAGNAGSGGTPTAGECAAGASEACGDCGMRTCDATTLKWGACMGDGRQQACWKTEAGAALPGTIPAAPKGSCHAGQQTCQANANWSPCTGAVAPAATDDCNTAGNDANCDGTPNGGCNCVSGTSRVCGKDTGNCQTGMQTCTNQVWGGCVGEIVATAADSCATTGDDANCNGVPNEGCACTPGSVATACNDNVACTTDGCNNGVCTHGVSAGYCLIGTSCVANNTTDTTNPCRYCDATANKTAWSNSPTTTKCDDGLWCNGDDTCNSGACTHQFTGNRCTATGSCALTVCDEARDSCFKPSSASCKPIQEKQCDSTTACGANPAHIQSRTNTQYCSGDSSDCTGTIMPGTWSNSSTCQADQICNNNGLNTSCVAKLGCGTTWCNGTAAGTLCWTLNNDTAGRDAAATNCSTSTAGGVSGWQLASIWDYTTIAQGCDGRNTGATYGVSRDGPSTCRVGSVLEPGSVTDCTPCMDGKGPLGADKKCYWATGMGTCNRAGHDANPNDPVWPYGGVGYWSQSGSDYGPIGYDPVNDAVTFFGGDITAKLPYRCTRVNP